ncbi:uncharacterized protein [Euwallacea similis]|uniref:uncharacterized protein n=1 Tax=Euwallacea similis TaxID=1736056 RepID=UPI00344ECE46
MTSDKGKFCIKSIKQRKSDTDIVPKAGFHFAEALGQVYPLLEIIFAYLPYSDLKICQEVCESWRSKALEELSRRTAPSWFTCYKVGSKAYKANFISHSANFNYNNVDIGIILYDNYRIKLNKYICLHSNNVELSQMSVPEYLEKELVPKSVDYCMLSVHRVASYFDTSNRCLTDVQYHGSTFDGVFIPKIPSVRTVMFHCNPSKKKEVEATVKHYVRPNEVAKCLLLFCKTQLYESLYTLLECLLPKDHPNSVALGGGVVRGTKTFQKFNHDNKIYTVKDTVCILFLKDQNSLEDNFKAYSCVIRGNHLSKEEFDSKLLDLKKNVTLKRHTLGFRLCCSAKYQESELQSFHDVFPGIPLLGLDAYGEIGWDCYPNARSEKSEEPHGAKRLKRNKNCPCAENIFSTIVVLITWD